MRKFVLAALAVVAATVSFSATAEAGHRHRHHGWQGHYGFWGPGIIIRPRPVYYRDYCFTKKIKRYDDWGNVYIRRVRVCG